MSQVRISDALLQLKPGAEWSVNGNTYEGINWLDKTQTKPTKDEVNKKIDELKAAEPMNLLREERDRLIAQSDWIIVRAKETSKFLYSDNLSKFCNMVSHLQSLCV